MIHILIQVSFNSIKHLDMIFILYFSPKIKSKKETKNILKAIVGFGHKKYERMDGKRNINISTWSIITQLRRLLSFFMFIHTDFISL